MECGNLLPLLDFGTATAAGHFTRNRQASLLLRLTLSDPICLALNGRASVSAQGNTGGGNRPCMEVLLARGLNAA